MPSLDLTRSSTLFGGRLFSFGLLLLLAVPWGAPRVDDAAPGTQHVADALLEHPHRTAPYLAGPFLSDPYLLDWRKLRGLNYRTGEVSDELKALEGRLVKMAGFPVPFEDFATNVTEFLLVPYEGACIHAPAPPPNQVIWVKMYASTRASLPGMNPVWVEGTLHIESGDSVYGEASYRVVGMRVYPYLF